MRNKILKEKWNLKGIKIFGGTILTLIFHVIFCIVLAMLISLAIHIISYIPIISNLFSWFIESRGDGLQVFIVGAATYSSVFFNLMLISKIIGDEDILHTSCRIAGIILIVLCILSGVINFFGGNYYAILINVLSLFFCTFYINTAK